ncbi:TPA: hypothetical protein GDG03_06170 [Legionella pneumophila]|nr:hypothetical protein [Legionella pneumophila]
MINVFLEKYNNYFFFILNYQVMLQPFYPGCARALNILHISENPVLYLSSTSRGLSTGSNRSPLKHWSPWTSHGTSVEM